ncbi:MAG: hypothetical protein HRU03_04025 [Nanoarchaeales archaeon]|nr:hypothetical protein [Nanoarchaeales archaeon]
MLLHNILKNYFKNSKFLQQIGIKYIVISPFEFGKLKEQIIRKNELHGHYNKEYSSLMFNDLNESNTHYDAKLKVRFYEIGLAYVEFLKNSKNFRALFEKWRDICNSSKFVKFQDIDLVEDMCRLFELFGYLSLKSFNKKSKFDSIDLIIKKILIDKEFTFDKNYNQIYEKLKLLYKFGFIPKHIKWIKEYQKVEF